MGALRFGWDDKLVSSVGEEDADFVAGFEFAVVGRDDDEAVGAGNGGQVAGALPGDWCDLSVIPSAVEGSW